MDKDIIEEETVGEQVENNFLDMSDEEIMNAPIPNTEQPIVKQEEDKTSEGEVENDAKSDTGQTAGEQPAKSVPVEEVDANKLTPKKDEPKESLNDSKENKEKDPVDVRDYKADVDRILSPFKANGKEITPKNIDDAISLMQMGANYHKKMAALKPNLAILKLLENNGLMDETNISFLIDLHNKSPEAINKLVKDSGINPLDFDAEKANGYKQQTHSVDQREIDLDTVLDEIQDSPSYTRTLQVISKEWDKASKQVIATTPQLIKVINDHITTGIYDLISTEVERERVFGRLNGVSDLDAYRQIGDAIESRGGFNHLSSSQRNSNSGGQVVTPKPKASDDALNDKKRAASPSKTTASKTVSKEFNPLALSDAEFMKVAAPR